MVAVYEQLNLFNLLQTSKPNPEPRLTAGQQIFIVRLDRSLPATVTNSYICHEKSENPYLGYCVKYRDGSNGRVWDFDINEQVFTDEAAALAKAEMCVFPQISPENLTFVDNAAFSYVRALDNYTLKSFIAKVGGNQLYERDFYCYHFLRTYETTKDRDKAYKKTLNEMTLESETHSGIVDENPAFEPLYYVSDSLYASREYAERHSSLLTS